ncbi:hypothetical protein ACNS7O_14930 (plasmid) [Haloferacaceae archaeon DSL9]
MDRLDTLTLEERHEMREQISEGKPRERLLAAIGRKQGDQIETLAGRRGVVEKPIRTWLYRGTGRAGTLRHTSPRWAIKTSV